MTTLITYTGHKKKSQIRNIFDNLKIDLNGYTIIEAFSGMFGFSSYVDQMFKIDKYVLNDIDPFVFKLLSDVKDNKYQNYIDELNNKNNIIKDKDAFQKYKQTKLKDIENNNIELFCYKYFLKNQYLKTYKHDRKIDKYEKLINIVKKSDLYNYDYKVIMEKYKNNKIACIYLDPPYLNSFNKDYGYNQVNTLNDVIDNTNIYIDIIKYLQTSKALIIMSMNSNALTRYLYNDFIINEYSSKYQNTKRKENILIISNINHLKAN